MKRYKYFSTKTLLVAFTATLFTVTACNNPASSEEEEHHEEPVGAVLTMNGQEIAHYEGETGEVTGGIEVDEGEETTLITIQFIAEDGDLFQPDDPEFTLRWKDIDTSIADVEQHDEDGKWSFHIHGETQGNTSVVFQIWHEPADHSDFNTAPIPVTVN